MSELIKALLSFAQNSSTPEVLIFVFIIIGIVIGVPVGILKFISSMRKVLNNDPMKAELNRTKEDLEEAIDQINDKLLIHHNEIENILGYVKDKSDRTGDAVAELVTKTLVFNERHNNDIRHLTEELDKISKERGTDVRTLLEAKNELITNTKVLIKMNRQVLDEVLELEKDISSLHGTILGINSNRKKIQ